MKLPSKESGTAKIAFQEYCKMGPRRSLEKVAGRLKQLSEVQPEAYIKVSMPALKKWSVAFSWVERAAQYDVERAEERELLRREQIEELNDAHLDAGMQLREEMIARINELLSRDKVSAMTAVQALDLATKLERLALGADEKPPVAKIDAHVTVDASMIRESLEQKISHLAERTEAHTEEALNVTV